MIISNIVGNLGKDAELKDTDKTSVTNFSIATRDYNYKTKEKETIWVDCSLWGKRGESLVNSLKKGTKVAVNGRLSIESYTSRNDGEVRFSIKMNVDHIDLCNSKSDNSDNSEDVPW